MVSKRASDSATTAFLVERYLPPAAAASLAASVARVVLLCADPSDSGGPGVHYLQSAYLPAEDTCFCLFSARDSDAVRAINSAADFALDRITDAVLLHPSDSRASDATSPPDPSGSTNPPAKG